MPRGFFRGLQNGLLVWLEQRLDLDLWASNDAEDRLVFLRLDPLRLKGSPILADELSDSQRFFAFWSCASVATCTAFFADDSVLGCALIACVCWPDSRTSVVWPATANFTSPPSDLRRT